METTEFEENASQMRPKLTAHCQRYLEARFLAIDAEDIVQETLMRLWKMGDKLYQYQSIEALGKTIASHLCIDYIRKSQKEMEAEYLKLYKESPMKAQDLLQHFSDEILNHAIEVADGLVEELFTRLTEKIQKEYLFHGA